MSRRRADRGRDHDDPEWRRWRAEAPGAGLPLFAPGADAAHPAPTCPSCGGLRPLEAAVCDLCARVGA